MRLQIRDAKGRARAFRPFDQDESRLPSDVAVADALEQGRAALEAIQVEVVNGAARMFRTARPA